MIPYLTEGLGLTVGALMLTAALQHKEINYLEAKLETANQKVSLCLHQKNELLNAIAESNSRLNALTVDYENAMENFSKVDKVKYVTKYIKDVNTTRGDCHDTKTVLDYIRTNGI